MPDYQFTNNWFLISTNNTQTWKRLLARYQPSRVLEIGSYEGASACFIIETCAAERPLELHCVDTWQGSIEHQAEVMSGAAHDLEFAMHASMEHSREIMGAVERRFDHNVELARSVARHPVQFAKHKTTSQQALTRLLAEGRASSFDFVYVDGSHTAPDVLSDAVLSFALLRVGGLLVFDDYLWAMGARRDRENALDTPKPAIDAFANIYHHKLVVLPDEPLRQIYMEKVAE
ncbi:MAG: class I SAM-dependent methyltransferase [Methylobacillus sp.]|jgi:predicted O-methyltransferase YrrM|nr:class I SAM-dependent methyltransferase [Methylobacillus sp.]